MFHMVNMLIRTSCRCQVMQTGRDKKGQDIIRKQACKVWCIIHLYTCFSVFDLLNTVYIFNLCLSLNDWSFSKFMFLLNVKFLLNVDVVLCTHILLNLHQSLSQYAGLHPSEHCFSTTPRLLNGSILPQSKGLVTPLTIPIFIAW